jgi:hypothetical protein
MITILDDVLTKIECDELIDIYKSNLFNVSLHGMTYPLKLKNIQNKQNIALELINKINTKVHDCVKNIEQCLNIEIVKWPVGSMQDYHTDITDDGVSYNLACITYLNDDFDGGYTQFLDSDGNLQFEVKPKIGKTVLFNGVKYMHGVNTVQHNDRYTVPMWYRTDE